MPLDDSTTVVTVRGFAKLRRGFESKGNEIKGIRRKGSVVQTTNTEHIVFAGMMRTIDSIWAKFESAWELAVEYSITHDMDPPFPSTADATYFSEIQTNYYEAHGYYEEILKRSTTQATSPASITFNASRVSGCPASGRTILPKINIKHFRGEFATWPAFKQLFVALIKDEPSLTDAERFHFLLSYLEGPALDTIKAIPVTDANFNQAWDTILQVYDNKRKLACSYIEKLLTFKSSGVKPTAESLQSYLSNVSESIVSLKALNIPHFEDYLLCELGLRSLDPVTRKEFEISIIGTEYPAFTTLKDFVQGRFQVLRLTSEPVEKPEQPPAQSSKGPKKPNSFAPKQQSNQALLAHTSQPIPVKSPSHDTSSIVCPICREHHILLQCPTFKSSTPSQRLDSLKQWSGCRNCLHPFHKTKECKSKWCCRFYKQRHHSDLHLGSKDTTSQSTHQSQSPTITNTSPPPPPGFSGTSTSSASGVLLGTVRASLLDNHGQAHTFRGILDPGSQFSFITENCARKLGKTSRPFQGNISGVNGSPLRKITGRLNVSFKPQFTSVLSTEAIVVPSITPPLPQSDLDSSMWQDYVTYNLSDPDFTVSAPISFLIGADLYADVVTGAPIIIHANGPRLIDTVFGFTVMLKQEVLDLLAAGGFELGKWSSNYPPLLDGLMAQQPTELCNDEMDHTVKILGMIWDPHSDLFKYSVRKPGTGTTKRDILSVIARLYDPLGYLAPVVFFAKCILQETWKSGIGWDEDVPQQVKVPWDNYLQDFSNLSDISIPRILVKTDSVYRLVGFSDASEKGYCAMAYLHGTQGNIASMSLLKAKTRLAPLKSLTVPRLELCGALLLSQLIQSLSPLIANLNISSVICFTDSTIVLAWLRTPVHQLQTFVANRTQQILSVTSENMWYHIDGVQNPADVGSRGVLPSSLIHHDLWWSGPKWCSLPFEQWPITQTVSHVGVPELKPAKTLVLATVQNANYIITCSERYSSFLRLIRVLGYVRRFISNSRIPKRNRRKRKIGPLSSSEFHRAHVNFVKLLQHHHFPDAYKNLEHNALPLELRRLSIFFDHEGVMRVGGRLSNAPLTADQRHPILLPSHSPFTQLVIDHLHKANHHPGPTALVAFIRHQYWIPRARNLVRLHKMKCVTCTRFSKAFVQPFMGDLPLSRVKGVRPFLHCGVDFAGPFVCRESSRRNAKTHKSYLAIFLCMSSRVVHLELCTSLSVEAFLDVFDRFIARRGIPAQMLSDCGTNFVGAAGYLREAREWINDPAHQSSIVDHTSHLAVEWCFNPPGSPHFGGSWESAVKAAKTLLRKTLGDRPFTESELNTLFVKVEGIMNSRPITPLSDSPDDAEVLTPGHFTIGQAVNALPEPDLLDIPTNRLDRWQLIRERVQHFWLRWKDEYLCSLQARNKWTKRTPNLRVGDLVFMKGAQTSPAHWPMARIVEVHPGKDDTVRVVTLRTIKGIFKRSSVNLIPLPVNPSPTQ